jgi:hypothetical protein
MARDLPRMGRFVEAWFLESDREGVDACSGLMLRRHHKRCARVNAATKKNA